MKKILIGIDISKETIDVSVIFCGTDLGQMRQLGYSQFENRPAGFRRMLSWQKKLAKVEHVRQEECLYCCETTGGYDHALCTWCNEKGVDIWRESALEIKKSMGLRRGKNDKADSLMIAEYAMRHRDKVRLYEPPSQDLCDLRDLLLYRENLSVRKTAAKVRATEKKRTSSQSKTMDYIYKSTMKEVERLEQEIQECERRMREIIENNPQLKRNFGHITSMNGVALINATALIVFTGNFITINDPRSIANYFGLVTFYEDSGTSVHRQDGTKHLCNNMCKKYITSAATNAIKTNKTVKAYYDRLIAAGKPDYIAMNNVKHKLIHIIFSLVTNDCDFEENHEYNRKTKKATRGTSLHSQDTGQ